MIRILALIFALFTAAPAMASTAEDARFFTPSLTPLQEVPFSGTLARMRAPSVKAVGSAIRVCLDPTLYPPEYAALARASTDREWWVTPAHLFHGSLQIDVQGQWEDIQLEYVDAGMDLILFSTPKRSTAPCIALESKLRVPYGIGARPARPELNYDFEIHVEALFNSGRTQKAFFARRALVAVSAFPGRDEIDGLIQIRYFGMDIEPAIPGVSGGLVASNGKAIGMIVAVDPMTSPYALPAPLMLRRITRHFERDAGPQDRFDRLAVPGGVQYLPSQAIYFRGMTDGSGRLNDGSGRLNDGAAGLPPSQQKETGIWLDGKLWKYLSNGGDTWIAGERLPRSILELLETPARLNGIYRDTQGRLRSQGRMGLPSTLLEAKYLEPARTLELELSDASRTAVLCRADQSRSILRETPGVGQRFILAVPTYSCETDPRLGSSHKKSWLALKIEPNSQYNQLFGDKEGPGWFVLEAKLSINALQVEHSMRLYSADPKLDLRDVLNCISENQDCKEASLLRELPASGFFEFTDGTTEIQLRRDAKPTIKIRVGSQSSIELIWIEPHSSSALRFPKWE